MSYIDRNVLPYDPRLPPKFWKNVEFTTDGCWIWMGNTISGYGVVKRGESRLRCHRIAYEALVGPILTEATDHLCRNRACVNPCHIEPVTDAENILRGVSPSAQNAVKEFCVHGHPLSGSNLKTIRGAPSRRSKSTWRVCRECGRIGKRRRRAAARERRTVHA